MRKNAIKTTSMITANRIKTIVVISGGSSAMPSGSTAGKRDRQMIGCMANRKHIPQI